MSHPRSKNIREISLTAHLENHKGLRDPSFRSLLAFAEFAEKIEKRLRYPVRDGIRGMPLHADDGLAGKHGITVLNAPGILDEGYRGEVMVILYNSDDQKAFRVNKGDRIAQLVVVPYFRCEIVETEDLDDTERGEEGFDSTGCA